MAYDWSGLFNVDYTDSTQTEKAGDVNVGSVFAETMVKTELANSDKHLNSSPGKPFVGGSKK